LKERFYDDQINCVLNFKSENTVTFSMKGLCESSSIQLENEGKL